MELSFLFFSFLFFIFFFIYFVRMERKDILSGCYDWLLGNGKRDRQQVLELRNWDCFIPPLIMRSGIVLGELLAFFVL